MKKALAIVAGLLLLTGVFLLATGSSDSPAAQNTKNVKKTDLIIGKPDAPATIVEYADFKCPSCNLFMHTTEEQLRREYVDSGKLKIVFRAFPFLGPDSQRAATGAYCANAQGKFVEYHDEIYNYVWDNGYSQGNYAIEGQDILTEKFLAERAAGLGMNKETFTACLKSKDQQQNLQTDVELARADGTRGTPTFRVNDQTIVGPQPFNVFKTLVDIQLRQ